MENINKKDYISGNSLSINLDKVIIKESKILKKNISKKDNLIFNFPIKNVLHWV